MTNLNLLWFDIKAGFRSRVASFVCLCNSDSDVPVQKSTKIERITD